MPSCPNADALISGLKQCELETSDTCNSCALTVVVAPRDVKLQKALDSWRKAMQKPRPMRSGYTAMTLALLFLISACGPDPVKDTGQSDFMSLKPGSTGSEKAGTAATASPDGNTATVKVEDSDVVRMIGSKLFILNAFRGLQAVDVADAAAPKLLGRVATQGTPREMYVADGIATVLLSEHYTFSATAAGSSQMRSSIGSQVQIIDLANPSAMQVSATIDLPGWVVASRRIDNRLIVVTADVGQTPWWGWCWGPYACMATASASTGTVGSGGSGGGTAMASPAGLWWPWGGSGYGAWANSGHVSVIEQKDPKTAKLLGTVEFAGGVAQALIQAGEVIVLGSQWQYENNVSTRIDRTQQITVGADGAVQIAAKEEQNLTGNDIWYAGLRGAAALGAGELAVTSSTYAAGTQPKVGVQVRHRKVVAQKWTDLGTWQAQSQQGWWDVRFDGKTALVSEGGWQYNADKTTPTTLHVLDLTDNPTETALLILPGSNQPVLATLLGQNAPGLWLLSGVRSDPNGTVQTTLRTLSLKNINKPELLGGTVIEGGYAWWGAGTEVLPDAGVILAAVQSGDGKNMNALKIVTFDPAGKLTPHGTFGSKLVSWWQLRSLAAGNKLWRIGNQALESIEIADLDQPKPLATLELAAQVSALALVNSRVVALVTDWQTNTAQLRTLKKDSLDEQHFDAVLTVPESWGRLLVVGNVVWFIGNQAVRAYDFTDPLLPKARGTWSSNGANNLWYDLYSAVPNGAALWLVSHQSIATYAEGDACAYASSDGGSTEPGTDIPPKPGADADVAVAVDASAPADADVKAQPDAGPIVQKCVTSWQYSSKITALDLTDPDQPVLKGAVTLPDAAWAWGAHVTADTLWLTHYESAQGVDGNWYGKYFLDRVNIANISAPALVGKVNVPGWIVGVTADNNHAYALDWQPKAGTAPQDGQIESQLDVLSLEGDKAFLLSKTTLPGSAGATLMNGSALYVSAWQYPWLLAKNAAGVTPQPQTQLFVLDMAQLDAPKLVQTLNPGAPIGAMALQGKTLVATIGWGAGVQTWQVNDPLAPVFKAFTYVQGQTFDAVTTPNGLWMPAGWGGIVAL